MAEAEKDAVKGKKMIRLNTRPSLIRLLTERRAGPDSDDGSWSRGSKRITWTKEKKKMKEMKV